MSALIPSRYLARVGPLRPGDTVTVESTVIGEFSWLIVPSLSA